MIYILQEEMTSANKVLKKYTLDNIMESLIYVYAQNNNILIQISAKFNNLNQITV